MRIRVASLVVCLTLPSALALTGCGISDTASPTPATGLVIQGSVHGGQSPIIGAHVYLFAASTTGYGTASTSLLVPSSTGTSDSVGAYVLTGAAGSFTLTGEYTCPSNSQVYLYALGGNTGSGTNTAAGLLASLGNCPSNGSFATTTPFVYVNEVSTVASAFTLAGYAVDATHIASSGTALALTGITNAFGNATNLVPINNGTALATTPAGNGTVPQTKINTIANILAACVNTASNTSMQCTTLFANARSGGSTGTMPTDTATAAINIAHYPGTNVAALYGLATPNQAFAPALASQPNDFVLGVNYSGGGINQPYSAAIDAQGDAWFTNLGDRALSKLSSTGSPLSPATGFTAGNQSIPTGVAIDLNGNAWIVDGGGSTLTEYTSAGSPAGTFSGGGISAPQGVAIDGSGNIWISNFSNSSISEFNSSGTALSGATGDTGGGVNGPIGIAIDHLGSPWVTNQKPAPGSISKFNTGGGPISGPTGFLGAGVNNPFSVAIDNANNVWIANYGGNSVSELNSNGVAITTSAGYTGGGLSEPYFIAVDGAGNIWVANNGNNSVTELTNAGVALSPALGFTNGGNLNGPQGLAIDGSGNVWIANAGGTAVTEFLGVATPVVTPLSAAVKANTLGARP